MAGHVQVECPERAKRVEGQSHLQLPKFPDDGIVVCMAWVYILRCGDASLYVGHTVNLDERERAHNEGRGGPHTAKRRPVKVVYAERAPSLDCARRRERQLKRWSGQKKEALVAGNMLELKRLSQSHSARGARQKPAKGADS